MAGYLYSGITNGAATDKLVAALEGVDCDVCITTSLNSQESSLRELKT